MLHELWIGASDSKYLVLEPQAHINNFLGGCAPRPRLPREDSQPGWCSQPRSRLRSTGLAREDSRHRDALELVVLDVTGRVVPRRTEFQHDRDVPGRRGRSLGSDGPDVHRRHRGDRRRVEVAGDTQVHLVPVRSLSGRNGRTRRGRQVDRQAVARDVALVVERDRLRLRPAGDQLLEADRAGRLQIESSAVGGSRDFRRRAVVRRDVVPAEGEDTARDERTSGEDAEGDRGDATTDRELGAVARHGIVSFSAASGCERWKTHCSCNP
jgi:hypothetical protein